MSNGLLFTSESISENHPGEVADQVSDVILNAILAQDKYARVAAGTLYSTGLVVPASEITTVVSVDYIRAAHETIKRIGYDNTEYGTDYRGCTVLVAYDKQSPGITQGINHTPGDCLNQDAGDQGLMFGYTCNETPELMPFPIYYVHHLVERQSQLRRDGRLPWLHPDARSQATMCYVDGKPHNVDTVVLSTQHTPETSQEAIRETVIERIIKPVLPSHMLAETEYLVNPTGHFAIGGPQGDCGLIGRKITVDTYSGAALHSSGAFSGKDPSKVNRSVTYATRYMTKNVMAAGLARQCQVQVSYAIDVTRPINITVCTEGTGVIPDEQTAKFVQEHFDLRPKDIVQMLDLLRPVYEKTAAHSHLGYKKPESSWEATDKVLLLCEAAGLADEPVKVFV